MRFANLFAGGKRRRRRRALVRALAQIGPSYVKLGQFLATRPDIVGGEIADALTALQDRMEPFGREKAVAIVEKALGKKIDEIFVSFGEPVAAASVAQVHVAQAQYKEGVRKVAVKVLRPGIEGYFARDLRDMYRVARLAERYSSEARRLRMIEVVDTLARTVRLETDFRLEAAAASEIRRQCRRRSRDSRAQRRLGPHGSRSVDARMDRRRSALGHRAGCRRRP